MYHCPNCGQIIQCNEENDMDEKKKFAEWLLQQDIGASTLSIKNLAKIYVDEYEAECKLAKLKER